MHDMQDASLSVRGLGCDLQPDRHDLHPPGQGGIVSQLFGGFGSVCPPVAHRDIIIAAPTLAVSVHCLKRM